MSFSWVAANSRTGTLTSPKDTAPFQIALIAKHSLTSIVPASSGTMKRMRPSQPAQAFEPREF